MQFRRRETAHYVQRIPSLLTSQIIQGSGANMVPVNDKLTEVCGKWSGTTQLVPFWGQVN
jgi:hypothetical protein